MNLDTALVLLIASINAVAGFSPSFSASFTSQHASRVAFVSPKVRVASSALLSEVEEAAEATTVAEEASVEPTDPEASEEEQPAEPEFDTAIYIGNISFDAAEGDLRSAFSAHGTVQKVQMPLNRETGRSRGFAFVTMSNAEEHAAAIEALNETELAGRTIYVSESLPKEKVNENKKKYQNRKQSKISCLFYFDGGVRFINFDLSYLYLLLCLLCR